MGNHQPTKEFLGRHNCGCESNEFLALIVSICQEIGVDKLAGPHILHYICCMFNTFKRSNIVYLSLLLIGLLMTSCGTSKKVPGSSRGNSIPTDASDMRGKPFSGNRLERYAAMLGVNPRELRNKELYNFIDSWMGSPHRMGGINKSGVDCSGFVGLLYHNVYNKDLPRSSREMGAEVKRKYLKELKEGDLVFFSFGGRQIDHVGVYLHNNKFVHVSTRKGVIISNISDSWYRKYFVRSGTPKI